MLRLLRNKKAQNTAEYAIMIVVVIAVFSGMQLYLRRALQARYKGGIDNVPGQVSTETPTGLFGTQTQYDPYYQAKGSSAFSTTTTEGIEKATIAQTGGVRNLTNATTTRTGNQVITSADTADTTNTTP